MSLLVPMYQAETAPPWIRGALISTYQLFITLGIFLAACFNYGTYEHQRGNSGSWRIVLGIGWVFAIVLGVGILAFPDTPRYNYRMGRIDEARETMVRVFGAPAHHYAIHTELEEIEAKLRAEAQIKHGPIREYINMFRAPRMGYRIALGVALQAFQQLTGANYFFYYGTTIFKGVGINNSYVTQMILNGINFGVTFIGLYLVEHYGRRKSLIGGAIWMFVCFMIFASVGHFALNIEYPDRTKSASTALIVFACLFILGYATTWGPMVSNRTKPLIWTFAKWCNRSGPSSVNYTRPVIERRVWRLPPLPIGCKFFIPLYPPHCSTKPHSNTTVLSWNFLIAFFTPFITKAIDFRYGYVFAGCNLAAAFIVWFFVLEGQGRTLEELDTMYIEKVVPWKSAKWEAPSAEEMSRIRKEAGTELAVPEDQGVMGDAAHDVENRGTLSGETERNHASGEEEAAATKKEEEQAVGHQERV